MNSDSEFALEYLKQMSSELEHAVLFDTTGRLVESTFNEDCNSGEIEEQIKEIFAMIDGIKTEVGKPPDEVELTTDLGSIFIVRDQHHTLVTFCKRSHLPALALYDARSVLADLKSPT